MEKLANQMFCILEVIRTSSINLCDAGGDSCLIGFGTKRDLKCELIVDWQRARCPRPTLLVSHDTITVGGLRGRKVGGRRAASRLDM